MAIDPITKKQIKDLARERGGVGVIDKAFSKITKAGEKKTLGAPSILRVPTGPPASRESISASDAATIRERQKMEREIPEAEVWRAGDAKPPTGAKKKKKNGF